MKYVLLVVALFSLAQRPLAYGQTWQWATGSAVAHCNFDLQSMCIDKYGNSYSVNWFQPLGTDTGVATFGTISLIDSTHSSAIAVVSNDSNGHYRWAKSTTFGDIRPYRIECDKDNDIYILGYAQDSCRFDTFSFSTNGFLLKMNGAGDIIWVRSMPFEARGIVIDSNKSVFLTGSGNSNVFHFGTDSLVNPNAGTTAAIVFEWDSTGHYVWGKLFGGSIGASGDHIETDRSGNLVVAGTIWSDSFTIDTVSFFNASVTSASTSWVAKLDRNGHILWGNTLMADSGSTASVICTDKKNNVYVSGKFYGRLISGTDTLYNHYSWGTGFFLKLDSGGRATWARTITGPDCDMPFDLKTDDCSDIWLSGHLRSNLYQYTDSNCIYRYDTSGNLLSAMVLDATGDDVTELRFDHHGNIYYAGDYYNSAHFGSYVLAGDTTLLEAFCLTKLYVGLSCPPDTITQVHGVPAPVGNCFFTLYPNPANDEIHISADLPEPGGVTVRIIDMFGMLRYTEAIQSRQMTISTGGLEPGAYIAEMVAADNSRYKVKFSIIH